MAITDILDAAQGGQYYANAAQACGLSESAARKAVSRFAPAIATRLKDKASADVEAYESLLDLLEDGDGSDLDDVEAMTGSEAQADGGDILKELYGSQAAAAQALGVSGDGEAKAAALSATGVLAALAASNAQTLATGATQAADTGSGGGGLISIIIAALLKGLLQGAQRQLAPKRRRRRYTYSTTRRRTTTRRRKRTPGLDQVFREILTGRK
jgi:hypothetical protein